MKNRRFVLIVPIVMLLLLAVAAACRPAEPTPTVAPPTPSPEPTVVPPTPTPPPATPTPSLDEAIARAEPAVVRMTPGTRTWNGVMIDNGLILTTSRNLGSAPIASYRTQGGIEGQAWAIGRDDDLDLALLQVVDPTGPYPSLPVAMQPLPSTDQDLVFMHFPTTGNSVDRRTARVLGNRPDLNPPGFRYIQVAAPTGAVTAGGLLIDLHGNLRGLLMTQEHMERIGIGRAGESYGIGADSLVDRVLPILQNGVMVIRQEDGSGGGSEQPPALPAVFRGDVSVSGQPLAAGERIFARLVRTGVPDLWFSHQIATGGRYNLATGVFTSGYSGATVEFWYNAKRATQTSTYNAGGNSIVNLTFD